MPRENWDDLPDDVRAAVRAHTGPVERAEPASSPFSSHLAVVLETAEGRVFVKGLRDGHARAWTQEREAAVNPYVVPVAPELLWRVTAGGWDLLGFEHLAARSADYGPRSADLPLVVEAMTALGRVECPDEEALDLEDASQRWGRSLDDPADAVHFSGDTLLHTDWHHTNVLITGGTGGGSGTGEGARLVDWAWPTRGAAWIDPACWVLWLVLAGHSPHQAEQWAAKVPAWSAAPSEGLGLFAGAQARFWQGTAEAHPNEWTRRLSDAAARWAGYRHTV